MPLGSTPEALPLHDKSLEESVHEFIQREQCTHYVTYLKYKSMKIKEAHGYMACTHCVLYIDNITYNHGIRTFSFTKCGQLESRQEQQYPTLSANH